mmetsp:Transcript_29873/g.77388  ORF Transcript_29873/g.77388 Transcript_29873/m.77388 type:complete len:89 (+) Transcript_29873:75-341(+)
MDFCSLRPFLAFPQLLTSTHSPCWACMGPPFIKPSFIGIHSAFTHHAFIQPQHPSAMLAFIEPPHAYVTVCAHVERKNLPDSAVVPHI